MCLEYCCEENGNVLARFYTVQRNVVELMSVMTELRGTTSSMSPRPISLDFGRIFHAVFL